MYIPSDHETAVARFVSSKEIAEMYGISQSAIRRYARIGLLPHVRIGKLIRFQVAEVDAALRQAAKDL